MVCTCKSGIRLSRFSWREFTLLYLLGAFQLSFSQTPLFAAEVKPALQQPSNRPPEVKTLYEMGKLGGHGAELHRVSITGTARNTAGEPVKDADIYVSSHGWITPGDFERLRGHTRSDANGHFEFKDVQLFVVRQRDSASKPDEGSFTVFGVKDSYGFSWHPARLYRPGKHPVGIASGDRNKQATEEVFYQGEPIAVDLQFDVPATLKGVITDKQGHPLANTKVQLGYVDNLQSPASRRTGSCKYLKNSNPNSNRSDMFSDFSAVPAGLRETRTDEQGRYEFTQLRRDTSYSANIDPGLEFDPWQFTLLTTNKPRVTGNTFAVGYAGELNHQFAAPRDITVHVVQSDSGRPVANVLVTAHHMGKIRRGGIQARTDSRGNAQLRLVPDEYKLVAEPTPDQPFLYLGQKYFVPEKVDSETDKTHQVNMQLNLAAIVKLKVVNSHTGAPIPGVRFNYETYDSGDQLPLSTQTVHVDYPLTNAAGEIQAFMKPGMRRFVVAEPLSLAQAEGSRSERIKLYPGQITEVKIRLTPPEFLPTHLVASGIQPRENSIYSPAIQKKWHIQSELLRLTPLRVTTRKVAIYEGPIDTEHLLKDLRALDPYQIPDIKMLLNKFHTGKLDWYKQVLTAQGNIKHEARYFSPDSHPPHFFDLKGHPLPTITSMTDGWNTLQHRSGNNQASINRSRKGGMYHYVASPSDLCEWPSLRSNRPVRKNKKKLEVDIRHAGQRIIYEGEQKEMVSRRVIDQDTGFIFESFYGSVPKQFEQANLYFAPEKLANGLILPRTHISWKTYKGKVKSLEVFLIEKVEILSNVPVDAFSIALPTGAEIVDKRHQPLTTRYELGKRTSHKTLSGPVSDFAAYLIRHPYFDHEMETEPQYGRRAPSLEPALWLTADGKSAAPDLAGKIVLVQFWGTQSTPSLDQLPEMKSAFQKYAKYPVVFIGMHDCYTSTDQLQEFAQQNDLEYELAIDQRPDESGWFGKTMQNFRVRHMPQTAVIDKQGNLIFIGDLQEALQYVAQLLNTKSE